MLHRQYAIFFSLTWHAQFVTTLVCVGG